MYTSKKHQVVGVGSSENLGVGSLENLWVGSLENLGVGSRTTRGWQLPAPGSTPAKQRPGRTIVSLAAVVIPSTLDEFLGSIKSIFHET